MNECSNMQEIAHDSLHLDRDVNELKPSDMQQYAWRYFELHANQRMSVFKFFIGLATFLTASLLAASVQSHYVPAALLGALLALVSFVFWKLDKRTRFLIKGSERALEDLEVVFFAIDADFSRRLQLFKQERMATAKIKGLFTTYGECLNVLFLTFAAVGVLVGAISLYKSMY